MSEIAETGPAPSAATWPAEPEIHHHLHYRPFVALDVPFDPRPLLREAMQLREHFVPHRESDPQGSWRSLALRGAGGDYRLTTAAAPGADYAPTALAERCPATLAFLERITDLASCGRVRFMWLDPGGRVPVHADFEDRLFPAGLAVNVSLNMPTGCRLVADTLPDGTHTPHTVEVPFANAGSVVLFNNAKPHYLVNGTAEPRVHLIFHGPLRVPQHAILEAARRQNGAAGPGDVLAAILIKRADLGQGVDDVIHELRARAVSGVWPECFPVGVLDGVLRDDETLRRRCLHRITSASLYPLPHRTLVASDLDSWLAKLPADARYAVIVGSGTYVTRVGDFAGEVLKALVHMRIEGIPLLGHILDRMPDHGNLPCLHEQFAMVDLQAWRSWGCPEFGPLYGPERDEFPPYRASAENVHDDYTPLWLERDPEGQPSEGQRWWGTRLIASALRNGRRVVNAPDALRRTRLFSYPNLASDRHRREVDSAIEAALAGISRWVYCFNTEPLGFPVAPGFTPERLLSVAAGFKWLGILRHYSGVKRPRFELVDFNPEAIAYVEELLACGSLDALMSVVRKFMLRNPAGGSLEVTEVQARLDAFAKEALGGDGSSLLAALQATRVATTRRLDFLAEPAALAACFDRATPTLFWHSNAWQGQGALYRYCPDELEENYADLMVRIGARLDMPGRFCPGRQLAAFGERARPHTVLMGAVGGSWPTDDEWVPIGRARLDPVLNGPHAAPKTPDPSRSVPGRRP